MGLKMSFSILFKLGSDDFGISGLIFNRIIFYLFSQMQSENPFLIDWEFLKAFLFCTR
jgi:hypothetical protein